MIEMLFVDYLRKELLFRFLFRYFEMIYGRLFMWKVFFVMLEIESFYLKIIKDKLIGMFWLIFFYG